MDNHVNLVSQEAVKKLKDMAEEIRTCLFCTDVKTNDGSASCPMDTRMVDENGDIWFFSAKDSDKNKAIERDGHVQLFYSDPGKNSYLIVNGTATISQDRKMIEALWTPVVKAWFKGGKDDPNITLIKVSDVNAYFWDIKGNRMINFLKMVVSAATGKTLVDAQEGKLTT